MMRKIGVYVDSPTSSFLEGLLNYFKPNNKWDLRLECFGELDKSHFDATSGFAGVILDAGARPQLAREARDAGVAVVSAEMDVENPEYLTISPDDQEVGRIVGQHLVDRGFRHFAYCGYRSRCFSDRRLKAFRETCQTAAKSFQVYEVGIKHPWAVFSNKADRRDLARWLARLPRPVGIMVATDALARFVLLGCESIHLQVPEQASVASVDNNTVVCQTARPTLTSVDLNNNRRGFIVGQWLERLIAGEKPGSNQVLIEPTLVPRRSTDTAATHDEDVIAALRFIWKHSDHPLQVNDVVHAIPVSRRSLELRFKRELGRTMQAEIARVRIERAMRLLTETDSPTPIVAERAGYRDASQLSRAVRKSTGMTPTAYRRKFSLFHLPRPVPVDPELQ